MSAQQKIEEYLGAKSSDITKRVLDRIKRYVEIETPSFHAREIIALSELIEQELLQIGASVERIDAPGRGRNIIARFARTKEDARNSAPILMLAHMDTVHDIGTLAARPFMVVDDRAVGPGVYDMKAGLALLVEAMTWHVANETERRPVTMLITCDEEVGSHSVRALIDEMARTAAVVLVPEPCLQHGEVKTARKGVATYTVKTEGRAAHAGGEPGAAVSAITELVHQCSRVLALADHSKGTTINVGVIGGGTATNVIAANAEAGIDVRLAVEGEFERVDHAMRSLANVHPEAKVTLALAESRPPLVRNAAVLAAYAQARECAAFLGVDLGEGMSGGGSDGSLAAATGAAVLDGLGPNGGGAHAVDEHILTEDLPFRLALLCRLVERL